MALAFKGKVITLATINRESGYASRKLHIVKEGAVLCSSPLVLDKGDVTVHMYNSIDTLLQQDGICSHCREKATK